MQIEPLALCCHPEVEISTIETNAEGISNVPPTKLIPLELRESNCACKTYTKSQWVKKLQPKLETRELSVTLDDEKHC